MSFSTLLFSKNIYKNSYITCKYAIQLVMFLDSERSMSINPFYKVLWVNSQQFTNYSKNTRLVMSMSWWRNRRRQKCNLIFDITSLITFAVLKNKEFPLQWRLICVVCTLQNIKLSKQYKISKNMPFLKIASLVPVPYRYRTGTQRPFV